MKQVNVRMLDKTITTVLFIAFCCNGVFSQITAPPTSSGNSDGVVRIGNDLKASGSGVDVEGAIFLINDGILSNGILFAFSAYFRKDTPVRFQIWRPQSNNANETHFQLVKEYEMTPSVTMEREDMYIVSFLNQRCTRVLDGDRLGLYFVKTPTAVAFVFDATDPRAFGYRVENSSNPLIIGDNVTFDSLVFPYDFSASAYIVTEVAYSGLAKNSVSLPPPSSGGSTVTSTGQETFVNCPKDLLIPGRYSGTMPTTAPTPPPTGAPGATGPAGPRGAPGIMGPQGVLGPIGASGGPGGAGGTGPEGGVGATGLAGATGVQGPGGRQGGAGATGPSGEKGNSGPRGPQGVQGPPGTLDWNGLVLPTVTVKPAPVAGADSIWSNPMLVLALLIWLAVVTLVLLVVFVAICILWCRKDKKQHLLNREPSYETAKYPYKGSFDDVNDPGYANEAYPGSLDRRQQKQSLYISPSQEDLSTVSLRKNGRVRANSRSSVGSGMNNGGVILSHGNGGRGQSTSDSLTDGRPRAGTDISRNSITEEPAYVNGGMESGHEKSGSLADPPITSTPLRNSDHYENVGDDDLKKEAPGNDVQSADGVDWHASMREDISTDYSVDTIQRDRSVKSIYPPSNPSSPTSPNFPSQQPALSAPTFPHLPPPPPHLYKNTLERQQSLPDDTY